MKPLRFAALIRVSSEGQEDNTSLESQRKNIKAAVKRLAGTIVDWYGGQEHATPGYEKAEIDRLYADAIKGQYDAMMVSSGFRWSRDVGKSAQGIEIFKERDIRFFELDGLLYAPLSP